MQKLVNVLSICVFVIFIQCGESAKKIRKLPTYFPQCYRNDPDLSKCLLDATEKVRPYMVKGVPELRIPAFEPFNLPQVVLQQGTQSLNFKAVLNNVTIHGLTKYKFTKFDFDVPNLQFFVETEIPALNLEGDYDVTGRILIAPIEGKGKFKARIDSCTVKLYQKCRTGDYKGNFHIIPYYTNTSIEVSGPKAELDGLFGGNAELSATTNKAINDNVDELFAELKPVVEETLTKIMEDLLVNHVALMVPFDYLYPVKK